MDSVKEFEISISGKFDEDRRMTVGRVSITYSDGTSEEVAFVPPTFIGSDINWSIIAAENGILLLQHKPHIKARLRPLPGKREAAVTVE